MCDDFLTEALLEHLMESLEISQDPHIEEYRCVEHIARGFAIKIIALRALAGTPLAEAMIKRLAVEAAAALEFLEGE